ncbi:MAG: MCE family protein, partial [Rhodobacteraceae bacterium]|nr:MCE family protein [Paracoccaceae bacterium]
MTEPGPSDLDVSVAKRSPWRNLSFVWAVPILALVVSLALAWQSFSQRGVLIEITFQNASGVTPGETTLRFRDVAIGTVEDVTFTPDLSRVLVRARVDKDVAPFLDAETEFWVVRPKVSARGITGLSTVLSGVFIEGAWDQEVGAPQWQFEGREEPPLVQPGRAGKRITLVTNDGNLISEGAPVFFHGIEVGRLERPRLTITSDSIVVDAFIEAPHDRRLNAATRFWDTSGFSVSLGGAGLKLDFDSLASVVAGGVAFDTIYEGGEAVSAGHVFNIYPDEAEARKSLFARSLADAVPIAVEFGESVSGLEPGAAVQYGGLAVGEVTAISAQVQDTEFGPEIRRMANLAIDPARLGLARGA